MKDEIVSQFDSLQRSSRAIGGESNAPDYSSKLTARLNSMETNLNARLISLSKTQSFLPNTEKVERLFGDALVSSKNALAREIDSLHAKLRASNPAGGGDNDGSNSGNSKYALNDDLLVKLTDQLASVAKSANGGVIADQAFIDKLNETRAQLSLVTDASANIAKLSEQLKLAMDAIPTSDDTRSIRDAIAGIANRLDEFVRVGDKIDTLVSSMNELRSASDANAASIEAIRDQHKELRESIISKSRLSALHDELTSTLEAHRKSMLSSLLARLDDCAAANDYAELRKLLETAWSSDDATERFAALNKRMNEFSDKLDDMAKRQIRDAVEVQADVARTVTNANESAGHAEDVKKAIEALKTSIAKNFGNARDEAADRLYDRLVQRIESSTKSGIEMVVRKFDDVATRDLSTAVANLSKRYDDLQASVRDQCGAKLEALASSVAKLRQRNADNYENLLNSLNENELAVSRIAEALKVDGKLAREAAETMDKLLKNGTTVLTKLSKLETKVSSLSENIPKNSEFWSNLGKVRADLKSHDDNTVKRIDELLDLVRSIGTSNADTLKTLLKRIDDKSDTIAKVIKSNSNDSEKRVGELLVDLEKRLVKALVKKIETSSSPEALEAVVASVLKTESASAVIERLKSIDAHGEYSTIVLKRLADVNFETLNDAANEKLLGILETVKAQSNVRTVLDYVQKNMPNGQQPLTLIQGMIDRLNANKTKTETMLARLDDIADKVDANAERIRTVRETANTLDARSKTAGELTMRKIENVESNLDTMLRILNSDSSSNNVGESNLPNVQRQFADIAKLLNSTRDETARLSKSLDHKFDAIANINSNLDATLKLLKGENRATTDDRDRILKLINTSRSETTRLRDTLSDKFKSVEKRLEFNTVHLTNELTAIKNSIANHATDDNVVANNDGDELKLAVQKLETVIRTIDDTSKDTNTKIDGIEKEIKSNAVALTDAKRVVDETNAKVSLIPTTRDESSRESLADIKSMLAELSRHLSSLETSLANVASADSLRATNALISSSVADIKLDVANVLPQDTIDAIGKINRLLLSLKKTMAGKGKPSGGGGGGDGENSGGGGGESDRYLELMARIESFEKKMASTIDNFLYGLSGMMAGMNNAFSPDTMNKIQADLKRLRDYVDRVDVRAEANERDEL